jgi:hypothetical protein
LVAVVLQEVMELTQCLALLHHSVVVLIVLVEDK